MKEFIKNCKKKPNAYFGYAVSIPLDIPEEDMARMFAGKNGDESKFSWTMKKKKLVTMII